LLPQGPADACQWPERQPFALQGGLPGLLWQCEELTGRLLGVETRTDAPKRSTPSPAFGGAFYCFQANCTRSAVTANPSQLPPADVPGPLGTLGRHHWGSSGTGCAQASAGFGSADPFLEADLAEDTEMLLVYGLTVLMAIPLRTGT